MRKRVKDSMRQSRGKKDRKREERKTNRYIWKGKRETKREEGNRVRSLRLYYDFLKASSAIF